MEPVSAIDIALWDLCGKAAGMPVYMLLGGAKRKEVIPYATGLYRRDSADVRGQSAEEYLVEEALKYKAQGFAGIKMKVGFGVKEDIAMVKAVRAAIGGEMMLAMDANHAYSFADAYALANSVENCGLAWFEEPVIPEDTDSYALLRQKTGIPIAGGEAVFTRQGFLPLLMKRGVDIAQPDTCATGGITEMVKIGALCETFHTRVIPHSWGSSIALAAAVQMCLVMPDVPASLNPAAMYLEFDRTPNIFREKLALEPVCVPGQNIVPTEKPGLGIEIDRKIIEEYRVV